MNLVCIGLSHRTAPVEVREKVAFSAESTVEALRALEAEAGERVLLSTCNRTELYAVGEAEDLAPRLAAKLDAIAGESVFRDPSIAVALSGREAALHLTRVACGLESMVLGEAQILGQVENALALAKSAGSAGAVLGRLFGSAVHLGQRARAETEIGRGAVSVSSAAVALAKKIFGSLEDREALVLGAGEMGALAARHLRSAGVGRLAIANRTVARAEAVAEEVDAEAEPLCGAPSDLSRVDVVVSAVSGGVSMLTRTTVRGALRSRAYRPLLIVDVAVPRSVDPAVNGLENVFLQDVDSLRHIIDANLRRRKKAAEGLEPECEAVADRFVTWWRSLSVEPTLRDLRSRLSSLAEHELERTMRKLPAEVRTSVETMTRSIVNKILHAPTERLRGSAGRGNGVADRLAVLRELFDIEESDEDPDRDAR
jgi:glutamyl-tRNA reductase